MPLELNNKSIIRRFSLQYHGIFFTSVTCFDSPYGLVKIQRDLLKYPTILHTKLVQWDIYILTFTAPRMSKADVLFIHIDSPLVLALVVVRDTLSWAYEIFERRASEVTNAFVLNGILCITRSVERTSNLSTRMKLCQESKIRFEWITDLAD